ncbi:MAG: PD-(D/E)XK nuclease family transposase, partial [Bacilli bacterium]|nr:PD-(D/E)XK nuclease family transposase [Bacilli bacterium]
MILNERIILNDSYFRNIFGNEKNKMCLCCLLSEIIKEDYKYIYDNIVYLNKDLSKNNKKDRNSILDVLVKVGEKIINVEAYTSYNQIKRNKNLNYISKLWFMYYNQKNKYKSKKEIIQINFIKGNKNDIYYLQGKNMYTKNIKVYDIRVDNKDNLKYTKSERNLMMWCKLLNTKVKDTQKIRKIIEKMNYEKEVKEKMRKEVEEQMEYTLKDIMTTTWDSIRELDIASAEYEGELRGKKVGLAEGKKAGLAEGLVEGKKNTIFKHIMKMLKMNMKYSDISEITGVSVEKIQE